MSSLDSVTLKINHSPEKLQLEGHTHLLVEYGLFLVEVDQGGEGVVHGGQH